MSDYNNLLSEIDKGIEGDCLGIPLIKFPKLNKVTNGIRAKTYTLLGGNSGTGKTAFIDSVYVLGVFDYMLENPNIKIKIHYFSMERSKIYKLAKWLCLRMYMDHNIRLDVPDVLGWNEPGKMSPYKEIFQSYIEYFNKLLEVVEIYEGGNNPTGVSVIMQDYFKSNGHTEQISQYKSVYVPDDPNILNIGIIDHIGRLKRERGFSKKETIDKMSEYIIKFRDFYNMAWFDISQFNRNISDPRRLEGVQAEPADSDFKETSEPFENCDLCIALFNPSRYKLYDYMDYKIKDFTDSEGNNTFRSIRVIKNSYGLDDARLGLYFNGECGFFKELPKAEDFRRDPQLYNEFK